jgi:hypothetical protein
MTRLSVALFLGAACSSTPPPAQTTQTTQTTAAAVDVVLPPLPSLPPLAPLPPLNGPCHVADEALFALIAAHRERAIVTSIVKASMRPLEVVDVTREAGRAGKAGEVTSQGLLILGTSPEHVVPHAAINENGKVFLLQLDAQDEAVPLCGCGPPVRGTPVQMLTFATRAPRGATFAGATWLKVVDPTPFPRWSGVDASGGSVACQPW